MLHHYARRSSGSRATGASPGCSWRRAQLMGESAASAAAESFRKPYHLEEG